MLPATCALLLTYLAFLLVILVAIHTPPHKSLGYESASFVNLVCLLSNLGFTFIARKEAVVEVGDFSSNTGLSFNDGHLPVLHFHLILQVVAVLIQFHIKQSQQSDRWAKREVLETQKKHGVEIANLKESNEKLVAQEALKLRFMAHLCEKMRGPLDALNDLGDKEPLISDASARERNSLMSILDDVEYFAMLEAGTLYFEPRKAEMGYLASETVACIRKMLGNRGIEEGAFQSQVNLNPEYVLIDSEAFQRMVLNIVLFAFPGASFTRLEFNRIDDYAQQQIVSEIQQQNETFNNDSIHLEIKITHMGPNVSPSDAGKLFQPFIIHTPKTPTDMTTTTTTTETTGLETAIANSIIQKMNGKTSVEWKESPTDDSQGICISRILIPLNEINNEYENSFQNSSIFSCERETAREGEVGGGGDYSLCYRNSILNRVGSIAATPAAAAAAAAASSSCNRANTLTSLKPNLRHSMKKQVHYNKERVIGPSSNYSSMQRRPTTTAHKQQQQQQQQQYATTSRNGSIYAHSIPSMHRYSFQKPDHYLSTTESVFSGDSITGNSGAGAGAGAGGGGTATTRSHRSASILQKRFYADYNGCSLSSYSDALDKTITRHSIPHSASTHTLGRRSGGGGGGGGGASECRDSLVIEGPTHVISRSKSLGNQLNLQYGNDNDDKDHRYRYQHSHHQHQQQQMLLQPSFPLSTNKMEEVVCGGNNYNNNEDDGIESPTIHNKQKEEAEELKRREQQQEDDEEEGGVEGYLKGSILLVDDSTIFRHIMKKMLLTISSRYEIFQAGDGLEAIQATEVQDFDLIFMDLEMPNMNGYNSAKLMRERGISTPIIAISAKVIHHNEIARLESSATTTATLGDDGRAGGGMTKVLSKPISKDMMIQLLKVYNTHTTRHHENQDNNNNNNAYNQDGLITQTSTVGPSPPPPPQPQLLLLPQLPPPIILDSSPSTPNIITQDDHQDESVLLVISTAENSTTTTAAAPHSYTSSPISYRRPYQPQQQHQSPRNQTLEVMPSTTASPAAMVLGGGGSTDTVKSSKRMVSANASSIIDMTPIYRSVSISMPLQQQQQQQQQPQQQRSHLQRGVSSSLNNNNNSNNDNKNNNISNQKKLAALVVDDSLINRQILVKILERDGVFQDIVEVSNGLDAVKMCLVRKFNVVFMDLEMPGMNGDEATARIRNSGNTTPIIAVTGNLIRAEDLRPLLTVGITQILTKPVSRQKVHEICALIMSDSSGESLREDCTSSSSSTEGGRRKESVATLVGMNHY
ncbi:hypothetical protein BDR26DRAFT_856455 [Obelidium mucronatum]|nr:hypothetical protein BDR26DRAFT_856455 [Obelidium mucronatum]